MIPIVPMEQPHVEAVAQLEKDCFSHPWTYAGLLEELENPTARFFVALQDGHVCGYAGMHHIVGECYITNVAVLPGLRRQGIGRRLMERLVLEAQREHAEMITLEVRPSNCAAIALYQSMGFLQEGRRKNFYTEPKEDALLLTRRFLENRDIMER